MARWLGAKAAIAAAVGAMLLASMSAARAQEVHLEKIGGAIGDTTRVEFQGTPGRHYWLLFSFQETRIDLGDGLVLHVGFEYLPFSAVLPGFMGALDDAGQAVAEFDLPDDPALQGLVLSMQCAFCSPVDAVSNLIRVTPALRGTFSPTWDAPDVPILGGVAAEREHGDVRIVGDTVPFVHTYDPDVEEFHLDDLGCAFGVLSARSVLPDGRVFLSGGLSLEDGQPTTRCVLYDPEQNDCIEYQLSVPRAGHATAVTANGEVLIVGGFDAFDGTDVLTFFQHILSSSELFDPESGEIRAGPDLLEPKAFHTATTTSEGDVMVAGGLTLIPIVDIPFVSITGYLFDERNESFGFPVFFSEGRMLHSATLLDNERVLLAGGVNIDFEDFLESGDIADLKIAAIDSGEVWRDGFFDGSFDHAPGMSEARALPAVVALPGARALVAGGLDLEISGDITEWVFEAKASADLYESLGFTQTGSMAEPRLAPSGILLEDGTVLVFGGGPAGAETYQD